MDRDECTIYTHLLSIDRADACKEKELGANHSHQLKVCARIKYSGLNFVKSCNFNHSVLDFELI